MSTSEKSLLGRFVAGCGLVLFAAVMLWLAVCLIQQIWLWLLAGVLLVAAVWVAVLVIRRHRDGWFR